MNSAKVNEEHLTSKRKNTCSRNQQSTTKWVLNRKEPPLFLTFLLMPFAHNYAPDLAWKVINESCLESFHTCHAPDSLTEYKHSVHLWSCRFTSWCSLCGSVCHVWLQPWSSSLMEYDSPHLNAGERLLSGEAGHQEGLQNETCMKHYTSLDVGWSARFHILRQILLKACLRHELKAKHLQTLHRIPRMNRKRDLLHVNQTANTQHAMGPLFSRAALRIAHLFLESLTLIACLELLENSLPKVCATKYNKYENNALKDRKFSLSSQT